jgi:STE24 endopeptidase
VSRKWALPAAVAAALVAAQAAVLLLRPYEPDPPAPEPATVTPGEYFSRAEIRRAEDFRSGQRWLFGAVVVVELGVLAVFVRRPPRLRSAAVTAVLLSVAITAAALPVRAVSRERARDVGLVTQSVPGWLADVGRGTAIGAAIAGAGGALLVFTMRRLGRRWWVAGAAVVVGFGAATAYLSPVVLDPIFNRFTPLPAGDLRSDVLDLADRAGVDVGEVFVMDASRRTTAANAYVAGLGGTKRVVLYDNLLEDFRTDEVRLVVAHELAHVSNRDVARGLLYLALVAPLGMLAVARISERLGAESGPGAGARAVPAVALALALMAPPITAISNQLSREVERRADLEAMRLTREPASLVDFQRRITVQNVGDPDPPALWHALMGTHPTPIERIARAEALAREP